MCLGNRAESSAHFINGQLKSLWDNATKCAQKHAKNFKPTESVIEFGTSLAQFYGPDRFDVGGKRDTLFFAKFNAPHVEFVCNHEIVLFLNLKEGYYHLDTSKTSPNELREDINNFKFALRVPYTTPGVQDISFNEIGAGKFNVELLVLDFAAAEVCYEHSVIPGITTVVDEKTAYMKERRLSSLTHYITKHYLPLLTRAGYHVLYSLPDFDLLGVTTSEIDYSVISKSTLSHHSLFNIKVSEINAYLRSQWLPQAAYIGEFGFDVKAVTDFKGFLSEHCTAWESSEEEVQFHVKFRPLAAQALCKREVILYFDIHEILFHMGGDINLPAEHKFQNWKIACLFDVEYEEEKSSNIVRIKLLLDSLRFCEHLSTPKSTSWDDASLHGRLWKIVQTYIRLYYIKFMERTGHHYIYVQGPNKARQDERPYWCDCETVESCGHAGPEDNHVRFGVLQKKLIKESSLNGFDQVTAVSQGSVNYLFASKWQKALEGKKDNEGETCLANYSLAHKDHGKEIFFSAFFGPPEVQFNCSEGSRSVIFYVTIRDGFLKFLGPKKSLLPGSHNPQRPFHDWRIAFHVDLNLRASTDGSNSKELVLDFSTAKVSLAHSDAPGVLEGDVDVLYGNFEAIIHYLKHHYFNALARANHNVLYKVQLKSSQRKQGTTLTSVRFQIYPFAFGPKDMHVESIYGIHHVVSDRNMILFLGMDEGAPIKKFPRSVNWVCGLSEERPFGTICVERQDLLDVWLSNFLDDISRDTTIIPVFSGVHGQDWLLDLQTWRNHAIKKKYNARCDWKTLNTQDKDSLKFYWYNQEEWRYEHRNSDELHLQGSYTVTCTTRNELSIPTIRKDGSYKVIISGTIRVNLKYSGDGPGWSGHMKGSWSTAITFGAESGLGVRARASPPEIKAIFEEPVCDTEMGKVTLTKVFKDLQGEFSHNPVKFHAIVLHINETLDRAVSHITLGTKASFQIVNPVFNRNGDLLFNLQVVGAPRPIHGKSGRSSEVIVQKWSTKVLDEVNRSGALVAHTVIPVETNGASNGTANGGPNIVPIKKANGAAEKVANA